MNITSGQLRKIHFLARQLDWDVFELHAELQSKVGKMSLRELDSREAGRFLDHQELKLRETGKPNIPPGRAGGKMRGKILKYKHLLGWNDYQLWGFAKRVVGHDVPVRASNHEKFNWVTEQDAYKILEGMKAIHKRKK